MSTSYNNIQSSIIIISRTGPAGPSQESPIFDFMGKPKKKRRLPLNLDSLRIVENKLKKSHAQYLIQAKIGSLVWTFWTRYSLMLKLHNALEQETQLELPSFPEKRFFGNLEESFIKKRSDQLDQYMTELFGNDEVRQSNTFITFLKESRKQAVNYTDHNQVNKWKLDS